MNGHQRNREYPSNRHEIKLLEAIAKSFLILDRVVLKTLKYKGDPAGAERFEKLTKGYFDRIENDPLKELRFKLRVDRFVSELKLNDLLDLMSRPERTTYYRDTIYLRLNACYNAQDEEEYHLASSSDEPPLGVEEHAKKGLRAIVEEMYNLDERVRRADDKNYAGEKILQLKTMLGKIDGVLERACEYLGHEYKPLANWNSTINQQTITISAKSPNNSLTSNPPAAASGHTKITSVVAFFVPSFYMAFFVLACMAASIFAYMAAFNAEAIPGRATDSDFYQLIASTILQSLGIGTSIWPIINDLRPTRYLLLKCWIYTGLSVFLTIAAVPLYVLVPVSWSGISNFVGTCMLSFVQLELMLGISHYKPHTD
ncbi:hypothetical protein BDV27DRAFT_122323 [Aspergillus caelatus]|uniref:Uncharacterized protein n=1 Tax=Aspergillus caelatus TaxID=61420 RepID=A0A5N7AEY9_9EURO|nr:uncharacterized protein BDV27DRAFT_122323 [Aspergillus caelatus]KAE8368434.1 hypothetical protein BDV27DRAFT_122323 [Aspergillus caelatus]